MIELPWMPNALQPNRRAHFMAKARATKNARQWAFVATKATDLCAPREGHIDVLLTFYPPTAHERDKDNLLASCKAYLDGIAQALGVNDSRFNPRVQIAEPVKNGRVVVSIGQQEARPIGEILDPIIADIMRREEKAA